MIYNDPVDISVDEWKSILADKKIITDSLFRILTVIYESENHEIRASEIALNLNISHYATINRQIGRFGRLVIEKTGAKPPLREDGTARWWHVPFLGYDRSGRFPWIMRPELIIAFEEVFGRSKAELVYSCELAVEETTSLPEGTVVQVFVNRYERNRQARIKCIAHYGSRCVVCGFDFEKTYGQLGKNKIHVHHLVPLSKIQVEYEVDPIRDLRPVCPNCHLIIHSRREPLSIEEIQRLIAVSRS